MEAARTLPSLVRETSETMRRRSPSAGDRPHRYIFTVHALDVETLNLDEDDSPTRAAFVALFHTLARAHLTVTFQR